jgi:hypothetical protein
MSAWPRDQLPQAFKVVKYQLEVHLQIKHTVIAQRTSLKPFQTAKIATTYGAASESKPTENRKLRTIPNAFQNSPQLGEKVY